LAVFVLVHPAWFGGWCWKKLVPLLEEYGHRVRTPTLTGLGERSHLAHPGIVMRTHIDDVASVLTYDDLREVILAGTSSSGAVISGVADRVPERISQLVYIDAFVPDDGQAVFDLVSPQRRPAMQALVESEGFGWLLPRLRPTPFGHFTSPVRLANPAAEQLPRTYIRCRGFPHPGFDRYAQTASQAPHWRLFHLAGSHLPYITSPHELAPMLLELAAS
jgi:pimeloyl-ACP methyl ester carboxylesterase